MATAGPNSPGTLSQDAAGPAWSNLSNVTSSNNTRATCSLLAPDANSARMILSNFGFSIPTGATIDGIVLQIEGYSTTSPNTNAITYLFKTVGGTEFGSTFTTMPQTTESVVSSATFSGSSYLWETTWTPAEINSTGFGTRIFWANNDSIDQTVHIDHVTIVVHYTPAPDAPKLSQSRSLQPILAQ